MKCVCEWSVNKVMKGNGLNTWGDLNYPYE
jgi:hypothetical protein